MPRSAIDGSLTDEAKAEREPEQRPREAVGDAPPKPKPTLARQLTKSVGFGGVRDGAANDRKSCAARVFGSRAMGSTDASSAPPPPTQAQSATMTDAQRAAAQWSAQPGGPGAELNA